MPSTIRRGPTSRDGRGPALVGPRLPMHHLFAGGGA